MYSIYSIPNYRIKKENWKIRTESIEEITNLIKSNNNYHERLTNEDTLKLNMEVDGCDNNIGELICDVLNYFDKNYGIKLTIKDIKITENKKYGIIHKNNLQSYHITIPKYNCRSDLMKILWLNFKSKYNYPIDVGHLGSKGKFFRLPNQTKGTSDKLTKEEAIGTEHIILNGTEEDFVLK